MERLPFLQKRAIRIMLKLGWKNTVKEQFKNFNIKTIFTASIFQTIILTKLNSGNLLQLRDNHNYLTRSRDNFTIPAHRLKFFEKTPTYMGSKFTNTTNRNKK